MRSTGLHRSRALPPPGNVYAAAVSIQTGSHYQRAAGSRVVVQHGSDEDPRVYPRMFKVDLLAGKAFREAGVSYQCHLSGRKHTCIEKDIEIVPLEKIVTVLTQDTFGITKILNDYRVETTFQKLGDSSTKVEISHYYSTKTLRAKLLNLMARGKIARETQAMLRESKQ